MRNRFIAASLCALGIAAIGAGSASAGVPEPNTGVVPDLTRPTHIEPRYTQAIEFFNADGLFRVVSARTARRRWSARASTRAGT
jgi:hypothetical protein